MARRISYLSIILLIAVICFYAYGSLFELKVKYWMPKMDGVVRVDDGDTRGTSIDIEDDLGIDTDDELVLPVEAVLYLGDHLSLWFGYQNLQFSSSSTVGSEFIFDGERFVVNAQIDSEIDLSVIDMGVEFDLVPTDIFGFGPCVRGTYFDGDAAVAERHIGRLATGKLSAFVPTVGAFARANLLDDKLTIYARVSGMTYEDNNYIDYCLEAKYKALPHINVIGGYRSISVDIEDSDVYVDAEMSGLFIGASVSF